MVPGIILAAPIVSRLTRSRFRQRERIIFTPISRLVLIPLMTTVFFFATNFGTKSPTTDSDWNFVNGLAGVGFSNTTDVVTGAGTLGSGDVEVDQPFAEPGDSPVSSCPAGNLTPDFSGRSARRWVGFETGLFSVWRTTRSPFPISTTAPMARHHLRRQRRLIRRRHFRPLKDWAALFVSTTAG